MARKRKNINAGYQSVEYWNRLLAAEGLSVDTGRHPKLIYAGGAAELDILATMQTRSSKKPSLSDYNDKGNQ